HHRDRGRQHAPAVVLLRHRLRALSRADGGRRRRVPPRRSRRQPRPASDMRAASPSLRRALRPARLLGVGLWLLLAAALGLTAWQIVFSVDAGLAEYLPRLADGFALTLLIVSLSLLAGALLAAVLTALRLAQLPLLGRAAAAFCYAF